MHDNLLVVYVSYLNYRPRQTKQSAHK